MCYYTSFELHLKVLRILSGTGVSPLRAGVAIRSKTKAYQALQKPAKKSSTPNPSDLKSSLSIITESKQSADQHFTFPVYTVGSYRTAPPQFWIMLSLFYFSLFYAVTKLVLFVKADEQEELGDVKIPERDKIRRPIFIVGSFVWTMYTCTCCAVYFVHFFKHERLCAMLLKWQILEGELISGWELLQAHLKIMFPFLIEWTLNSKLSELH